MKKIMFAAMAAILAIGSSCTKQVKPEPILPHDRQSISADADFKQYTSEDIRKGTVRGDWAIETVLGKKAVGETAPFLKFAPSVHRAYGNNGCNVINANYVYNAKDSTIRFSNMISTMMACGKTGITDYDVNMALDMARFYSWESKGSEYYLYLYDQSHNQVMQLLHQNFEFLNGTWKVTAINNKPVDVEGMKLVIDVNEGKLHGNTGCNILNGKFESNMDRPNAISFSSIATTRMACPDNMNYETVLLVALEEASSAKPISPEEVILYNSSNEPVLRLVRTTDTDD